MIDFTKFPIGVLIERNEVENVFKIANPLDKTLQIRFRYASEPLRIERTVSLRPGSQATFEYDQLLLGKESNIFVEFE